MSKQLQQQLDRLQHDHPIVRRHAVAGMFQLLAQHSMYASKHGQDALQTCLRQTHQVSNRACVRLHYGMHQHRSPGANAGPTECAIQDVLEETLLQLQTFVPRPGELCCSLSLHAPADRKSYYMQVVYSTHAYAEAHCYS